MPEVRKAQVSNSDESQWYTQEEDCFGTYCSEGDELSSEHWEWHSTTVHAAPKGEGMREWKAGDGAEWQPGNERAAATEVRQYARERKKTAVEPDKSSSE